MLRNLSIVVVLAVIVAAPFALRRPGAASDWRPGDPVLVIISPHNEAIRYEFARAFSDWHKARFGRPVKVDWRNIGGTTEILRYLTAEYVAAARSWWRAQGHAWPAAAAEALVDRRFNLQTPPTPARQAGETDDAFAARTAAQQATWRALCDVYRAFRQTDDPAAFGCRIDLFFGGGEYDHTDAFLKGLTVPPWPSNAVPTELFISPGGTVLIPERMSGETWRSPTMLGTVLSAFGICYNLDRLRDLGVAQPPQQWDDLTDPVYFRQIGMADPTKSGSAAKVFEMIIHQQCHRAVAEAGFSESDVDNFERAIAAAGLAPGELPDGVPAAYQAAVERGWDNGLRLIRRIGANARYFTDSAGKVPVDVGAGDAAVGLAIDFYGRFQAQSSRAADGTERMIFCAPAGGTSVSADPISLLRGAEHRALAVRFIEFVLSEEGQQLWTYRPGTPGGPEQYALRRLPIRRDFYPSDEPDIQAISKRHHPFTADDLTDPSIDPYSLAAQFTYRPRWTGRHFGVLRDLVRAMCLDSADELKAAWQAILANGGPEQLPQAMARLETLPSAPTPLTWRTALDAGKGDKLETMRIWTAEFRRAYRDARRLAEQGL